MPAPGAAVPLRRLQFAPILTATVLTVLGIWLVGRTADVLVLFFLSVLISLYLGAVAGFFVRRFGMGRRLALLLAVLGSAFAVGGLVYLLVPPVVAQTQQLVRVLPQYLGGWEAAIDRLVERIPGLRDTWKPGQHPVLNALYEQVSGWAEGLVPRVFGVVEALISIFSVCVMGLYLALHPGSYREWLVQRFPPVHRDLVRDVLGDLGDQLRRFIVGQLTTMSILGALTALGLYLLHVPYWLTFGVFTGAVTIVPFFGSLLSTLLPAAFVLTEPNGTSKALAVVGLGIVVHLLEGNVISPRIMSNALDLPPVLTIMGVLIMGKLVGGVGLVVALPVVAALEVIVKRILINRIYEGQGFRRTARDRILVMRVPVPEGGVVLADVPPPDLIALAERRAST